MKKLNLCFLALILAITLPLRSQHPHHPEDVSIWLQSGGGANIVHSADMGASPLHYVGAGMNMVQGITANLSRLQGHLESRGLAGMELNNDLGEIFAFDFDGRAEVLYRCYDYQDLHVWAGGTAQTFMDLKYYPQLMNASVAGSVFFNLHATSMVQLDFLPFLDYDHKLFSIYGKFSLPLFGSVTRPGFAYMDNYTSDLNVLNTLLQNYETHWIAFPGISTDIGIYLNLLNKNKIGLTYRWDYLTSRNKGPYRFDHAVHSFNVIYMFNIF
jgi:hypothetical protein